MDEIREIFWTGGWDSTFRMIQLSREFCGTVQPVYISGDNRKSEKTEIKTMETITKMLIAHPDTKATILPVKIIDKKDIPPNKEVTDAYTAIRKKIKIGTQYEFLGRYAINHPYIELGAKRPDGEFSGIREAIESHGGLIPFNGNSWVLNREKSTKDCILMFGYYSYPIAQIAEHEMGDLAKEWGYGDVMDQIWFCHAPLFNQPCGICRPCEQKMDENMCFLLPIKAQKRYRVLQFLKKIFGRKAAGIYRRLILFFNKK